MLNLKVSEHLENSEKNKIIFLKIMTFLEKHSRDNVLAEKWKAGVLDEISVEKKGEEMEV